MAVLEYNAARFRSRFHLSEGDLTLLVNALEVLDPDDDAGKTKRDILLGVFLVALAHEADEI